MTAPPGRPPASDLPDEDAFAQMLRAAALPAVAAGVACAVVAGIVAGASGVVAAVLALGLVVLFFGSSLLVLRRTARRSPQLVLVVALGTYTLKVVLLAVAFVLLAQWDWLSGPALGLSVIAITVVWLFFELRGFLRRRQPVWDAPVGGSA